MKKLNFDVGDKLKCKKTTAESQYSFKINKYYEIIKIIYDDIGGIYCDDNYSYHIIDDLGYIVKFYFKGNLYSWFDIELSERRKKLYNLQKITNEKSNI